MADVFEVGNGHPPNFSDGSIKVVVNGTAKGATQPLANETVGAFLKRQAQTYGVRTFSAFADGQKLDTTNAGDSLDGVETIEIVAKDSRGLYHESLRHIWHAA